MTRGWGELYRLSWRLGVRGLRRPDARHEAVIRLVIPLDPSRYIEMPQAIELLGALPGQRVLDLASPKLVAVALAGRGVDVTSVDLHEPEIKTCRALAGDLPGVRFQLGDGRALPFPNGSFDHAYSVSVLEHIPDDGDFQALGELARVVRPGGRVVLTMPFAQEYREDWHERAEYTEIRERRERDGDRPVFFFQRWNDRARLEQLLAFVPELCVENMDVGDVRPRALARAFERWFPALLPLGPVFPILLSERDGDDGGVVRITLKRIDRGGSPS
jgi:SAM-dependent methyltransferase